MDSLKTFNELTCVKWLLPSQAQVLLTGKKNKITNQKHVKIEKSQLCCSVANHDEILIF